MPSKKTSHITSSGPSYPPRVSPSVAMGTCPSPFPIITQNKFPSDVASNKPMMLVLSLI